MYVWLGMSTHRHYKWELTLELQLTDGCIILFMASQLYVTLGLQLFAGTNFSEFHNSLIQ